MTNTTLDRQVAEVLGWKLHNYGDDIFPLMGWLNKDGYNAEFFAELEVSDVADWCIFSPTTNWDQCGKLVEEYKIDLHHELTVNDFLQWKAAIHAGEYTFSSTGLTPQIAGCKALVAALSNS